MRFDFLSEPISADAPCGPDLEESGASDYSNYLVLAASRLPQRFFQSIESGPDRAGLPFDKASIDLETEQAIIHAFLQRTRDVRLLTLDARFQILAGNIIGLCEAIEGIALVVTRFWADFHPLPFEDGDQIMRINSLEGLVDYAQIILPLQHAPLAMGNRIAPVTYRNYLVATGQAEIREREERVALDVIERTLMADAAQERVQAVAAAVAAARTGLDDIRTIFITNLGHENAPRFDALGTTLDGIAQLLQRLASGAGAEPATAPSQPFGMPGADGQASEAAPTFAAAIPTSAQAKAALLAAENYFLASEASNPALVLIHQARMLVGRSLVEALESLLPETANRAMFRFESGPFPFEIDLSRMRIVTDDLLGVVADGEDAEPPPDDEPATEDDPGIVFSAATRGDAGQLLVAVEQFYRANEPSSAIPVLLTRARSFINKDFNTILAELMPVQE
ncbi:MAG TPA: type VI secretion system ImpA family N-terminal domain-containing protein [Devosia sp.]|nr:type VI secretion system ImpA family N-terminal domain-containing protein [Devosia sp.]